jgi:hypothetical protein
MAKSLRTIGSATRDIDESSGINIVGTIRLKRIRLAAARGKGAACISGVAGEVAVVAEADFGVVDAVGRVAEGLFMIGSLSSFSSPVDYSHLRSVGKSPFGVWLLVIGHWLLVIRHWLLMSGIGY